GQVLASPIIQRLSEQETDALRKIAEASTVYGDKHPMIAKLKSEREEIRQRMASEVAKVIRSLSNELAVAQTREAQLKGRLAEAQRENNVAGTAEVKLLELQRQGDAIRHIYETFLARHL